MHRECDIIHKFVFPTSIGYIKEWLHSNYEQFMSKYTVHFTQEDASNITHPKPDL